MGDSGRVATAGSPRHPEGWWLGSCLAPCPLTACSAFQNHLLHSPSLIKSSIRTRPQRRPPLALTRIPGRDHELEPPRGATAGPFTEFPGATQAPPSVAGSSSPDPSADPWVPRGTAEKEKCSRDGAHVRARLLTPVAQHPVIPEGQREVTPLGRWRPGPPGPRGCPRRCPH